MIHGYMCQAWEHTICVCVWAPCFKAHRAGLADYADFTPKLSTQGVSCNLMGAEPCLLDPLFPMNDSDFDCEAAWPSCSGAWWTLCNSYVRHSPLMQRLLQAWREGLRQSFGGYWMMQQHLMRVESMTATKLPDM